MFEAVSKFKKSVTLEPVIFLYVFSNYVMFAAEQGSNLMMNKICELELGYNRTTCLSRGTDFDDIEVEVQRYTNMLSQP